MLLARSPAHTVRLWSARPENGLLLQQRRENVRLLPGVRCPVMATFGALEVASNVAFRGLPDELRALAGPRLRLTVEVIDGADHFYTGARDELAGRVGSWLRSALPSGG